MAMIGKVLRMHRREKKSVREIVRATSLSRNTVRKYLRIGKAEAPRYRRAPVSTKLAPYVEVVQQALLADARRPKKERRTAKALYSQLVAQGYAGGYSRLTDYIRDWRACQGGAALGDAYVPLSFDMGEAFQFNGMDAPTRYGINVPEWKCHRPLELEGAFTMQVTTVGLDLAKNVFQVHGVSEHGKVLLRKQLRREQVAAVFANMPPCVIGMEACGGAHHWARKLQAMGHTVRLMAPQFVKPYVKSNKNDAADAEAICEAVGRPSMRFVPIKNIEQQSVLALHRVREGFVKARTAQANQIRGLLGEYGLVVPQGIAHLRARVPELLEDASNDLPGTFRLLIDRLLDHLKVLQLQADEIEAQIKAWHRASESSQRLEKVPGIGPLTATALVASVGDAKNFDNGRQLAAWLGLVPRQHSSGGKANLLGMSKRGDTYLRTLLIHGARSALFRATQKADPDSWSFRLASRRNSNVAAVALANKTARTAWALLAHGRTFDRNYAAP